MRTYTIAAVVLGLAIGAVAGIGGYTFIYARGYSYLLDDPAACANCHVMDEQYDAWLKGSHHQVAGCNDCHLPEGFVTGYLAKTRNGFAHGAAFTLGGYPEPIRIKPHNRAITEAACRTCHAAVVHNIDARPDEDPMSCVRCHVDVGHLH